MIKSKHMNRQVKQRAYKNKPLSDEEKATNKKIAGSLAGGVCFWFYEDKHENGQIVCYRKSAGRRDHWTSKSQLQHMLVCSFEQTRRIGMP